MEVRTFEHFPEDDTCPVCGSGEDKECVLIEIQGTKQGNVAEAQPVHAECVDPSRMLYNRDVDVVYVTRREG